MATSASSRSRPSGRRHSRPQATAAQPRTSDASRQRSLASANRWRDQYNPLRGLSIQRVSTLCDMFDRGDYADLQWAYRAAERSDETLFALVARRLSSIREMEWTVKIVDVGMAGFDESLAEDQRSALLAAYSGIDNLVEVISHLARSVFRGYSVLEKVPQDDGSWLLLPVDHWNVVRDGSRGGWRYNPDALSIGYSSLPESNTIDPQQFIIVTEPDGHLDRLGLVKYVRSALGIKDWTGFVETYAIPSGIVIMPPHVPPGKESEYEGAAERISGGAPGALPAGSIYQPNDQPRGTNPFDPYLDRVERQLVLAGTGGMLTMLTQSGSGTLAGGAHTETFRQIARAHGRQISECLQKQLDRDILSIQFPGWPVLAYFTLEFTVQPEADKVVDHAVRLAESGWRMSAEELSERTGYQLTEVHPGGRQGGEANGDGSAATDPSQGYDAILNRAADASVADEDLLADILAFAR